MCAALATVSADAQAEEKLNANSLIGYDPVDWPEMPAGEKSFSLGISLRLSPSEWDETMSDLPLGLKTEHARPVGSLLNEPGKKGAGISLLKGLAHLDDSGLTLGSFKAGYGQTGGCDSGFALRHNGTALEEPGVFYLKTCLRF